MCARLFLDETTTATECKTCVAGRYTDQYASLTCKACDPGKYARLGEQQSCDECPNGYVGVEALPRDLLVTGANLDFSWSRLGLLAVASHAQKANLHLMIMQ